MKQKQSNKARKNSKKTRKVTKRTKKQGRKKTSERERQGMKRRSEGNQGEKKWDIEKWTKITLFQGETGVFVNRETKKKRKVKGQLPQNTRAGLRRTKLKKRTQKSAKHERKRGHLQSFPLQVYKNAVDKNRQKNTGKLRKKHPYRSRKQISGSGPNRTQTATEV